MSAFSLPPWFIWPPPTRKDISIACIAWGWTLGFGFLTSRNCWKQTARMHNPFRSLYAWLIWLELINCQIQGLLFILLNLDLMKPSFGVFFGVLVPWVLQTQCILQIICNRIALVEVDKRRTWWTKRVVLVLVGLINVSVFVIWIPARMQISEWWIKLNDIWDRIEKACYLVMDLCLNVYFITTVKRKLVHNGLKKYNRLVRFNERIIFVSIMMDVLLLASMSFTSGTVYAQIHPVTYLIKLNIELALANLIVTIAAEKALCISIDEDEVIRRSSDSRKGSCGSEGTVVELEDTGERVSSYRCTCVVNGDEEKEAGNRTTRRVRSEEELIGSIGSVGSLSYPMMVRRIDEVEISSIRHHDASGANSRRQSYYDKDGNLSYYIDVTSRRHT